MPIGYLDSNETGVVIAIADAGVLVNPAGELASRTAWRRRGRSRTRCRSGDRRALQATREIEPPVVQITPDAPHLSVAKVASAVNAFIGHNGSRAAPRPGQAVAGSFECSLEKGLCCDRPSASGAAPASHTCESAAVLHHH